MSGTDGKSTNERRNEVGGERVGCRPLLVTIADAAAILAVGRSSIYRLIGDGDIATIHIGRSVRISTVELEDFVQRRAGLGR